jgi:exodeoxyribonuclease VIII
MAVESDYYEVQALSASAIKTYRNYGPKALLELGTAVHCLILEPQVFAAKYRLNEEGLSEKKLDPNFKWLSKKEWDTCHFLRDGFHDLPIIRELWQDPFLSTECPVYWEETGLPMKALADAYSDTNKTLIDLKTTSSSLFSSGSQKDFRADIFNFGYEIQQAHYCNAFKTPHFYFIALETKAPYNVGVFQLSEEAFKYGQREYDKAVLAIRNLQNERGEKPVVPIVEVALPSYLKYAKK